MEEEKWKNYTGSTVFLTPEEHKELTDYRKYLKEEICKCLIAKKMWKRETL